MQNSSNRPGQRKPVSTAPANPGKTTPKSAKAPKEKKGRAVKAFFIGLLIGLLSPVVAIIVVIIMDGGNLLNAVSNFSLEGLTAPILEMASAPPGATVRNIITVEQYNELEDGMTYKQVTNAVGAKGEVANKEKDTVEYVWIVEDDDEYTAATITFKGGVLSEKELT